MVIYTIILIIRTTTINFQEQALIQQQSQPPLTAEDFLARLTADNFSVDSNIIVTNVFGTVQQNGAEKQENKDTKVQDKLVKIKQTQEGSIDEAQLADDPNGSVFRAYATEGDKNKKESFSASESLRLQVETNEVNPESRLPKSLPVKPKPKLISKPSFQTSLNYNKESSTLLPGNFYPKITFSFCFHSIYLIT